MNMIVRLIDRLTGATGIIGAWMVVPLVLASVYEVISRYAFGAPTIWAFELAYMLTGANFLLGMAFALRDKAHIRIEIFYQFFPRKLQATVDGLAYVFIVIPLCGWLGYGLYEYAFHAFQSGETSGMSAWNPVIWPFRVTFALGFGMLALQGLAELLKLVRVWRDDELPETAVEPEADATHPAESI